MKYFFRLAVFGLVCEVLFLWFLMGSSFWRIISFQNTHVSDYSVGVIVTIFLGISATLLTGKIADRRKFLSNNFISALLMSPVIFTVGTLVGVLFNFVIQGIVLSPGTSLMENIDSWFLRPFYAFMMFGIPASLVVGILYWLGTVIYKTYIRKTEKA